MSLDNLAILHRAAIHSPMMPLHNNNNNNNHNNEEKPKLTMMLPDPTKYSPGFSASPQGTSSLYSGYFPHQATESTVSPSAQKPFSLPPIRELLKEAPQPQQQQHQPVALPQQQQTPFHSPYSTPDVSRSNSYQNVSSSGRISPVNNLALPGQNMIPTPEAIRSASSSPISESGYSEVLVNMNVQGKEKLNSRKKRQNLPRQTTLILLGWLSEHLDRPYPNSREKYELLLKTRLTIQQLDNWFINARRRKINILKKLKENDQSIALTF